MQIFRRIKSFWTTPRTEYLVRGFLFQKLSLVYIWVSGVLDGTPKVLVAKGKAKAISRGDMDCESLALTETKVFVYSFDEEGTMDMVRC